MRPPSPAEPNEQFRVDVATGNSQRPIAEIRKVAHGLNRVAGPPAISCRTRVSIDQHHRRFLHRNKPFQRNIGLNEVIGCGKQ